MSVGRGETDVNDAEKCTPDEEETKSHGEPHDLDNNKDVIDSEETCENVEQRSDSDDGGTNNSESAKDDENLSQSASVAKIGNDLPQDAELTRIRVTGKKSLLKAQAYLERLIQAWPDD